MTPITPTLRNFLEELADLMEKHRTTIRAVEYSGSFYTSTDGFEFCQDSECDGDGVPLRAYCEANFEVGTGEVDAERLRNLTAQLPDTP